ncbi:MAG TPA: hypothetical protein VG714_03180, partial [Acidobacteriaceae bacterium]|nr:hypothetical protein [Acidobacteriaceae bacterium]
MSNNDAFSRGLQENTYTGNGSDWADWSRGNMIRQEEERRRLEQQAADVAQMTKPSALPGYMPAPAAPTSSAATTMTPEEASAVFRFILRVL